jgi:hypothetical protein
VIGITAARPILPYMIRRMQRMEAPMTDSINSRAAIQARIAEWQRHYRNSEYQPADFLFGIAKARWVSWFRMA